MPGTICTETPVSTACAVFKIDFKGRFVYIDDETEELLGKTREELFGKSIYEFISNDSHQVLDTILGHHNRYESFYESLPLTIREKGDNYRSLEAVITLNFISGNPVNYQFILIPSRPVEAASVINWERRLLELMQIGEDEIDFSRVAEMFCAVGGYAAGECYIDDGRRNLEMVGSYPHLDPGHSAPIYLESFRNSWENRFSCMPEDGTPQDGFGNGKSEAVLPLRFDGNKSLLVWLSGPSEYRPPANRLEKMRLFQQTWNSHYQALDLNLSAASSFAVLGQAADAINLGLVIVNSDFDIAYSNEFFSRTVGSSEPGSQNTNFKELYENLKICDQNAQTVPFDQSPFIAAVQQRRFIIDRVNITGSDKPVIVLAGLLNVADTQLFIYGFMPYQDELAEADSQSHSGTKLILSVAHDIRAPLITIEAFAKRLQTGYADQFDNDGRFAVDCVIENCRILQEMLEGLGEISQNWLAHEAPENLYPKKLIEELVTYLKATYPNTQYRIRIPEGLPDIRAPKRKLVGLFRNILDNAFKYSAASVNPTVEIEYNLVEGRHQFSITDNGPGIDEDYQQKIFAPFFRSPEAVSLPGTGMGLAIASDIVSSWGGSIRLDTTRKSGTRILFTLPPRIKG